MITRYRFVELFGSGTDVRAAFTRELSHSWWHLALLRLISKKPETWGYGEDERGCKAMYEEARSGRTTSGVHSPTSDSAEDFLRAYNAIREYKRQRNIALDT